MSIEYGSAEQLTLEIKFTVAILLFIIMLILPIGLIPKIGKIKHMIVWPLMLLCLIGAIYLFGSALAMGGDPKPVTVCPSLYTRAMRANY